jgi:O-antigen ligase
VSSTRSAPQVREAASRTTAALPRLVPGTVVVALLVAFGRWGSYLGLPSRQLFVTDVLLFGSLVWTLVRYRTAIREHLAGALRPHLLALLPVVALGAWALVRGLPGLTGANGLRDLAPYAYVTVLALMALLPRERGAARRTLHVLVGALVVHAVWVTVSRLWPWPEQLTTLPLLGGMVRVMELRVDYDGAMLAVLAGLALYGVSRVRGTAQVAGLLAVCAWCSVMVLTLASRAALIALVVAYAVGALSSWSLAERLWSSHRRLVIAAIVLLVAALVVLVPQTPTYKRLTGDPAYVSAGGTMKARELAWTAVIDYTGQAPARMVTGVGMGPDFLKESGGAVHYQYVGGPLVRQPHNFPLNTYARLGLVGVALLLALYVALARAVVRTLVRSVRRSDSESMLDLTCVLVCGVLLVTSMLGVIIESPFGAIPFGWAAGLLLVRAAATRAEARRA